MPHLWGYIQQFRTIMVCVYLPYLALVGPLRWWGKYSVSDLHCSWFAVDVPFYIVLQPCTLQSWSSLVYSAKNTCLLSVGSFHLMSLYTTLNNNNNNNNSSSNSISSNNNNSNTIKNNNSNNIKNNSISSNNNNSNNIKNNNSNNIKNNSISNNNNNSNNIKNYNSNNNSRF